MYDKGKNITNKVENNQINGNGNIVGIGNNSSPPSNSQKSNKKSPISYLVKLLKALFADD